MPADGSPVRLILPVAKVQEGWEIDPITGAEGVAGWTFMITLADGTEVHPAELVTVNWNVPDGRPEMVVVVPVPVVVAPPGDLVTVQVPVAGKPLSTTLPVDTVQVGWVIVPAAGAVGVAG